MAVLDWVLIAGVAALVSLSLFNTLKNGQQERQLRESFYYLIETENGRISLMQLAATARVDAERAREYLDSQARVFSALPEVDSDGNTFYQFPKMQRSLPVVREEEDGW